jgi:hypothetical protein
MLDGIRQMFPTSTPARELSELHVASQRAATGQLPDWNVTYSYMTDLLAGQSYQTKRREQIYAQPAQRHDRAAASLGPGDGTRTP